MINKTDDYDENQWQRSVIEKVALEGIREHRRTRRWGVFFKLLIALYILGLIVLPQTSFWFSSDVGDKPDHVAVVEINGQIAPGGKASAEELNQLLRKAFDADNAKAVMLRINSPGGSPVQSGMVYDEINRLKDEHPGKTVYAVAEDIMASGAYYIASAADEIYADKASMVGSIGVIMQSFGFNELINELGIERRVYTAGENKAFMDPFKPTDEKNIEHIDSLLQEIHGQFKKAVTDGRGDRLNIDEKTLFSGLVWTGSQGVEKGIVDGLASPYEVAVDEEGLEKLITYYSGPKWDFMEYLVSMVSDQVAESIASEMKSSTVSKPNAILDN